MSDNDPAFLWETAALRDAPHRAAEIETDNESSDPEPGNWATLREASRATGIPVETLRKWARRSTIPTYLTSTAAGPNIRMVDLDGIVLRASELGRPLADPGAASAAVDSSVAPPATGAQDPSDSPPPGTMIVPIDAWNKMLNQLGNLHEAGQQLAEARERAAKAETESTFLRERLAELREDPAPSLAEPATPTETDLDDVPTGSDENSEKVWQFFVRRIRERRTG